MDQELLDRIDESLERRREIVTPQLITRRCVPFTAPEFVRIRTAPCCDRCGDFEPCNCDPRLLRQFWERG